MNTTTKTIYLVEFFVHLAVVVVIAMAVAI